MQSCIGSFPKRKKIGRRVYQILRMVTIEIVINYTRIMGIRVTTSCRYCIAFKVMLLVSSYSFSFVCIMQTDMQY